MPHNHSETSTDAEVAATWTPAGTRDSGMDDGPFTGDPRLLSEFHGEMCQKHHSSCTAQPQWTSRTI